MSKRFREIVSIETIADDVTGKRYIGLVDSSFIELVNSLADENEMLKERLRDKDKLLSDSLSVESNLLKRIRELEE